MKITPKTTVLVPLTVLILSSCATTQEKLQIPLEPVKAVKAEPEPPPPQPIQIADKVAIIGEKIWMNEGAAQVENLTVWKKGNTFASLGIGSFNWYPASIDHSKSEFPQLLEFLQQQGVILPEWLQSKPACPWNSREEFYDNKNSAKMLELRKLLKENISQQVLFIIKRLKQDLPTMLDVLPTAEKREHVHKQFDRMMQKPAGVYALIDYVNFQGKGISPKKPYQGEGWGLLQVLEKMSGKSSNVTREFAWTAYKIFERRENREKNAPKDESSLSRGWRHRLRTYTYEF